jgi:predicted transcriptional regulator
MQIRRFDLDSQGLERVLGELETRILETVWALGEPTVKEVTAQLGPQTHFKTVMTVMNRMVEKQLLTRRSRGRQFVYTAVLDREAFVQQVANRVLSGLLSDFGSPTMTHFLAGTTPEQRAELEQLLAKRRNSEEAS